MRYPAVAGAFYERSRDALLRQIKECYTHPLGPGRLAEVRAGPRRLVGLVVPHAGYVYSGPVAAHSYAALAADGWPKSFVIFGPNHHGQGAPLALTEHDWQTPLGTAMVDKGLHDALAKPPLEEDILAHRDEHSIEVQLPFLQELSDAVRFVPICMAFQEYDLAAEGGQASEVRDIERREPGHEDGGRIRGDRGLPLSGLRINPLEVFRPRGSHRVRHDARHLRRMDAPNGRDQFPYEGPPGLEDDDELARLLLRPLPPVPRFDRPVVGARRESSLDHDPSDRSGALAVRRGHVGHRVRNPPTDHPNFAPPFAIRVRNRNGFDGLLSGGPRVSDVPNARW